MFLFPLRSSSAALLVLLCGGVHAQSDPGSTPGGRTQEIARDSAYGNVVAKVYDGRAAYVRIETRERGAPLNQHPAAIEPATLRGLLMRVQLPNSEPVFDAAELDEIVTPLAQALARALPEQDVSVAVSGRHGVLGILAPRSVTTARTFFTEGRMNLIFGLVQQDWESRYRGTGYLIPFEPGKRASMVDKNVRVVATGGVVARRADWLELDPLAPPAVAKPDAGAPKPAVVIPAPPAGAAVSGPAAQPAAPSTPAPTAPAVEGDALYRQTAERLKALQKLRESGAITEEEYQQKRREILKGL